MVDLDAHLDGRVVSDFAQEGSFPTNHTALLPLQARKIISGLQPRHFKNHKLESLRRGGEGSSYAMSHQAQFEAMRLDVQRSAQAQCDQLRAEVTAQLQNQGQQLFQQQQDFIRVLGEQQSRMMTLIGAGVAQPPSPRPALNVTTAQAFSDTFSESGVSSAESYDPFSSAPTSTAISPEHSPPPPHSHLPTRQFRSASASHSSSPYPTSNPFPTFSTLHSLGGTDLLSPTRSQRTTLTDNDFIRTWSLDVHYTYINAPSSSSSTSAASETTTGGFMCRRCPHLDPAADDGNPNRRKFGFYKAARDKPASITKRAREHSLRHWREEQGEEKGKGHRRRRSEGDTKRPNIPKPENVSEEEAASSTGAISSREASPIPDFRPNHARSSSAPHYDLPDLPPTQHIPPSPSIVCVEYEDDLRFHPSTLTFDRPDDEAGRAVDQDYMNSLFSGPHDPMDTGSPPPPIGSPSPSSFQFSGAPPPLPPSSNGAMQFVNPTDIFMQGEGDKATHNDLFFSYP
ncbi:hypothetical protein RQP46_001879 [Phenoliferia psychrophenolica]